jgi:hypothetical protein
MALNKKEFRENIFFGDTLGLWSLQSRADAVDVCWGLWACVKK